MDKVFARLIFDRKMTTTIHTHPGIYDGVYDGVSRLVVNLQEAISIRVNTSQ